MKATPSARAAGSPQGQAAARPGKFEHELSDTREGELIRRTPTRPVRPTAGLSVGERRVFWRLLGACGDDHSSEVDVEEHCRHVARTVVFLQARRP